MGFFPVCWIETAFGLEDIATTLFDMEVLVNSLRTLERDSDDVRRLLT